MVIAVSDYKFKFINSFSRAFTQLMLGISFWSAILPTSKVLADTPKIFSDSAMLSISYEECKSRAVKAAKAVLSEIQTSQERGSRFKLSGTTAVTVAVIYCIEKPQGSVAIITTSAYWTRNEKEAYSVYIRLADFIQDGFKSNVK